MRLSVWREAAPNRDCMSADVLSVLSPLLSDLGAEADPDCWVAWGEDPLFKYSVLAPTTGGLISATVRPTGGEGPRVTAKLVRWPKLAIGELSIEGTSEHRIVAVQVEGQVLKGVDEEADRICEFSRDLVAAVDDRLRAMVVAASSIGVMGQAIVAAAPAVPPEFGSAATQTFEPAKASSDGSTDAPAPEMKALPAPSTPKQPKRAAPKASPKPSARKAAKPAKAVPAPIEAPVPAEAPAPVETWIAPHPIGAPLGPASEIPLGRAEPHTPAAVPASGDSGPAPDETVDIPEAVAAAPEDPEGEPVTTERAVSDQPAEPDQSEEPPSDDESGSAGPASPEALNALKKRARLWVP